MDENLIRYFDNYLLELLDKTDKADFENRLKSDKSFYMAFEQYKAQLDPSDDLPFFDSAIALNNIKSQLETKGKSSAFLFIPKIGFKIAASIIAVIVSAVIFYQYVHLQDPVEAKMLTKETAFGQKSTITLSDGSTIRLNSGSILRYPEYFTDSARSVFLEGEAFFDVMPDPSRPFLVSTRGFEIEVLGTSFNIKNYSQEAEQHIAVKSGEVAVKFNENISKNEVLTVGDKLDRNPKTGSWHASNVDTDQIAQWTEGYLHFENQSMDQVLLDLEKWFGVNLEIDPEASLENCRVTLKQKGESLKNILDILQFSTNLTYKSTENKIVISGKSC